MFLRQCAIANEAGVVEVDNIWLLLIKKREVFFSPF